MTSSEQMSQTPAKNPFRAQYPDAIANIINSGSGSTLLPRTCGHTNTTSLNCTPCQKWLQQINSGTTGSEPSICEKHWQKGVRDSYCGGCIRFSKQVETGLRIPSINVQFNEDIWSKPSTSKLPPEELDPPGPCNEIASLTSSSHCDEQQQDSPADILTREITTSRLELSSVRLGLQNTLTELFTPVIPHFETRNFGAFDKFIRDFEFDDDLRILNKKLHRLLRKTISPLRLNCKVSNWRLLQCSLIRLENALDKLEQQLTSSSSTDSDSTSLDEKELASLQETLIIPLQRLLEQATTLLDSWNAPYQDLHETMTINRRAVLYWTSSSGVPLADVNMRRLMPEGRIENMHEYRQEIRDGIKTLKAERKRRKNNVLCKGNQEMKALKTGFEGILHRL